jgi:CRP/FNR family transcriptional regulator, cyclic AMP receptor protein
LKCADRKASRLRDFSSGTSLGGEVSHFRDKQNIYVQGDPAETLFYIQKGSVRLSTRRNNRPAAVTAILGVGDFFGELCLVDYLLRMCMAVALTAASVRAIKKEKMLQLIRGKNKTLRCLLARILSNTKNYPDHVADLLTSSSEQRLAHVLLRLAHWQKTVAQALRRPT